MVSSVSETPSVEEITAHGKLIINAYVFPNAGCEDEAGRLILEVKKYADSDQEPGCLRYTVVRSYTTEGVIFALWEIYSSHDALLQHLESDAFKSLRAARTKLFRAPPDIKYFFEMKDQSE